MKKILKMFIIATTFALAITTLSACGQAVCAHDFESVPEVSATCTEDGVSAYNKCLKCGEERGKKVLPANPDNHTWENLDEEGNRKCTSCPTSEVYTQAGLATALQYNGEVTLMADIDVDAQISVPADVTVVLNMNDKSIIGAATSETNHVYPLSNSGNLTINGGYISGRGIKNEATGIMTINDTTIFAQDFNGGACIWSYGGEVYINNGNFTGNTGVVSAQGYLEINGGTYTCKSGISDEGEIITSPTYNIRAYAGLKITDGTFTSRHGVISVGGGEAVIEKGSFTIEFTATTTSNVLYIYGNTNLTVNGGDFISDNTKNKADSGTAILVSGSNASVTVNAGNYVGMNGMVSGNVVLYGGTFNTVWNYNHYDNLASKLAEGYTATQNADGSWTVSK